MTPSFCTQCGNEVTHSARFCRTCGAAIGEEHASEAPDPGDSEPTSDNALQAPDAGASEPATASRTRVKFVFPAERPQWILSRLAPIAGRRPLIEVVVGLCGFTVLTTFISTPGAIYYGALVMVFAFGLLRSDNATLRRAVEVGVIAFGFAILKPLRFAVVSLTHGSGFHPSMNVFTVSGFLSVLGTAALATILVAYVDPSLRTAVSKSLKPHQGRALDPARLAGGVAVAVLALFPLSQAFTGGFGVYKQAGSSGEGRLARAGVEIDVMGMWSYSVTCGQLRAHTDIIPDVALELSEEINSVEGKQAVIDALESALPRGCVDVEDSYTPGEDASNIVDDAT